jgi:ABC-type oligopeptide transport system substrate-binding subunit
MSKLALFLATTACVALLALLVAVSGVPALAQGPSTLRFPSVEPTTLDPARMLWYQEVNIGSQVFAGLTQMDKNSAVTPPPGHQLDGLAGRAHLDFWPAQ